MESSPRNCDLNPVARPPAGPTALRRRPCPRRGEGHRGAGAGRAVFPQNHDLNLRDMGNSNSGHVCHSPQHPSSPLYVSDSEALSNGNKCSVTGMAGEVDVHVSTIPLLNKVIQKLCEIILMAPWWPSQVWFPHLLCMCGPPSHHSILPEPPVTTEICLGQQVAPSAHLEARMQHYQAAGFSEEVSMLHIENPQQTECMMTGATLCSLGCRTRN